MTERELPMELQELVVEARADALAWVRTMERPGIRHGTLGAYTNGGCRCGTCQANFRAYQQARRLAGCR